MELVVDPYSASEIPDGYEQYCPKTFPVDVIPPVRGTRVGRYRNPDYVLGWVCDFETAKERFGTCHRNGLPKLILAEWSSLQKTLGTDLSDFIPADQLFKPGLFFFQIVSNGESTFKNYKEHKEELITLMMKTFKVKSRDELKWHRLTMYDCWF